MHAEIPLPKDPRHQRFSDLVLSGQSAAEAYRLAGFKASTPKIRSAAASRMLRNVSIRNYMAARQRAAAVVAGMEKDEAVAAAVAIFKARPNDASMDNPLCEVRWTAEGPVAVFPSKSKMLDRLSKMLGWDAPQKTEVDGMTELVDAFAQIAANTPTLPREKM